MTSRQKPPLAPMRVPRHLKKKMEKKPPEAQAALYACLRQLRENWRHPGLACNKLGGSDVFHAKASRGDRVTFFWDDGTIVIENHCNHDILKRY